MRGLCDAIAHCFLSLALLEKRECVQDTPCALYVSFAIMFLAF